MAEGGRNWMERNFEKPFFQIEMARCEMSKKKVNGAAVGALAAITILVNLLF